MRLIFWTSGAIAVAASVMVITRREVVHAILYLVVSLLAVAVLFGVGGAPFAAAVEALLYAGAVMVLFVFVVMLLDLGQTGVERERRWLHPTAFIGPALLASALLVELAFLVSSTRSGTTPPVLGARAVAEALYGPYLVGVELASLLLLAGLVAAFHLGRRNPRRTEGGTG